MQGNLAPGKTRTKSDFIFLAFPPLPIHASKCCSVSASGMHGSKFSRSISLFFKFRLLTQCD